MRAWGRFCVGIGLLATSASAWAMEAEYYTYNGFQETVDAFTRLALIFSSSNYMGLFASAAVAGILLGVISATGKGMMGGKGNLLAWAVPVLVGAAVYNGLILPKGTIHIYDKVKNSTAAVADVPDGLILIASLTNKVERIAVQLIDTAVADPRMQYAVAAGGISFALLNKASSEFTDVADSYLTRSLEHYWQDCGLPALEVSGSTLNQNEITRNTSDLMDSFEKMNLEAQTTIYYTEGDKIGIDMSCKTAWTAIKLALNDAATWDMPTRQLCGKAGFNVAEVTQLNACKRLLIDADKLYGAAGSAENYLRNTYLAKVVLNASVNGAVDESQSMLANRSMMTQSIGAFQTINEWMPRIRGWILSAILGLIPILAIFTVTPLFFRAAGLVLGLFVWFTTWGIVDAMLHRSAVDAGMAAFFQIRDFQYGLNAIWLTPEASVKALGVFGQAQMAAFGLASLLVSTLFKISAGSTLGSMASGALGKAQSEGSQAATTAATAEGQAGLISSRTSGLATVANYTNTGFQQTVTATAVGQAMGLGNHLAVANAGARNGMSGLDAGLNAGAITGGGTAGLTTAFTTKLNQRGLPATSENLEKIAGQYSAVEKAKSIGNTDAYKRELAVWADDASVLHNSDKFMEASTLFSMIDARRNVVDTAAFNDQQTLFDATYRKEHGVYPTEKQAIHGLGQLKFGHEFAKIEAFGGDTKAWMKAQVFGEEKGYHMTVGEMEAYNKAGIKPEELFGGIGVMTASTNMGTQDALKKFGPQAFVTAAKMDAARHAGTANAWEDFVKQRYHGDYKKAENEIGTTRAGADFANYSSMKAMAKEFTHGNILDAMINQGQTNVRMTVPQAEALKFGQNHHLSKEQMDLIRRSPNGVEMHLSMGQNGAVANFSAYSGSRVETSASSSSDTGNSVRTGWQMDGAVQGMLYGTHGEDIAQLRNFVAHADSNMDARMELLGGTAKVFDSISDARASKDSTVDSGGGIGVDSSRALAGSMIAKAIGAGANYQLSTNVHWADVTNWSGNRIMAEIAYPEIQHYARGVVDAMDSEGAFTGSADREAYYATIMASKLRAFAAIVNEENVKDGKGAVQDGFEIPVLGRVNESRTEALGRKAIKGL